MKNFKYAFTMIELVFVIVILGILSAVAIPKLSGISEDANFAQGMATVSSIRAAIASERQRTLIKGNASYPDILDDANISEDVELFDGNSTVNILQYPIYSSTDSGGWMKVTNSTGTAATLAYKFCLRAPCTAAADKVDFSYTKADGKFDCSYSDDNCKELVH